MATLAKSEGKIFIEYKHLVSLCAYIRQADLSIDRCRWTSWNDLHIFYKGIKDEKNISNFFIDLCKNLGLSPQYHELGNKSSGVRYIISILHFEGLKRRSVIAFEELETIYYLLSSFRQILSTKNPDPKHIELIRSQLANYYSNVLLPKLRKKDASQVLKIEHYLQNENLQTLPLNKIIHL